VPLFLDKPGLAGTVGERLILQRALAALIADRAVQRVVDEQKLKDAESVTTSWPSPTAMKQAGLRAKPRGPFTSTRHIRHIPTGFIRG
jgi:hypothetical protein